MSTRYRVGVFSQYSNIYLEADGKQGTGDKSIILSPKRACQLITDIYGHLVTSKELDDDDVIKIFEHMRVLLKLQIKLGRL